MLNSLPPSLLHLVLLIFLLLASAPCPSALDLGGDEERLIGYQERGSHDDLGAPGEQGSSETSVEVPGMWTEHVSWEPRATLFHNFLTPFECLYLIRTASPNMAHSQVVDSDTGKSVSSKVRTSKGAFLKRGGDPVIKTIEERIARVSHIPQDHGEPLHILDYEPGQEYQAHYDYFHDNVSTQNGGQRIATMLMYLWVSSDQGQQVVSNEVDAC